MRRSDGRKLSEAALNERRRRAVKMCLSGATIATAAKQCELAERTVWSAMQAYRSGGLPAVEVRHGHRSKGSGRSLSREQERGIQRLIRDHVPDQLKMDFALWTRQAVGELIQRRYGVELAVRSVGLYLERWGFTPQRPLKKAYEQSPEEVAKWVEQEYPKIARRARREGAEIQWGDETGLRSDDVRGRGYAPKGQTPVVLANARREKLSVISTVTNKGQMRWKVFEGALKTPILVDFMKRLVRGREKRVFLILDNLRVHHSKSVKEWVGANADKIAIYYLPSYAPERNPDELLNADLKQRVTKASPPRTKAALTRTATRALRSIQKQPDRVENYFQQKDVRYAAA